MVLSLQNLDVTPLIKIDSEQIIINAVTFWKFSITDNGIGIPEKTKRTYLLYFSTFTF
ncbi:hypothetical protein [Lacinutrix sp. Bg11-31]|uniref:hypothetical protein n=1 Tax=Lacinutrix sp. Bg11-31 TaxID=2057808 RepID=UPI0012FD2EF1|nr:hypothetical protein [Lacinutrix sp. Bg11-31]